MSAIELSWTAKKAKDNIVGDIHFTSDIKRPLHKKIKECDCRRETLHCDLKVYKTEQKSDWLR